MGCRVVGLGQVLCLIRRVLWWAKRRMGRSRFPRSVIFGAGTRIYKSFVCAVTVFGRPSVL